MQRAKEIVAKLQGKVGKFALIQDSCSKEKRASYEDIKNEAIQILLKLQYNPKEAQDMVDKALKRKSGMKTPEEVLNEVYKQRSE